MRSSSLVQSYRRANFLRKVMLVVFGFMSIGTLLWAMPWTPWGLSSEDYDSTAAVPVAMAFGAWISAFGAVYLRDQSNRYEQTLVTWSSVHDGLGDMRRREYFFERVVIECMRSDRSDIPFGIFTARFGTGENIDSAETATALEALAGLVRQTDTLAALGAQEIGLLGAGMGHREAPAFAYRLKSMLETTMGARSDEQVNVGWAIWGTDGRDATELIGVARSRMQRKSALRELGLAVDAINEVEDEAPNTVDESITRLPTQIGHRDDTAA